jgi:hypothetical protein
MLNRKIFFAALWLILAGLPAWAVNASAATSYRVEFKKSIEKSKIYKVELEYPEIKGYPNINSQNRLNRIIKAQINDFVITFKAQAKEEAKNQRVPFEQLCKSEIKYQSEHFISIVITNMFYLGGAHPDYRYATLKDLFKAKADYLTALAQLCSSYLTQKANADPTFIKEGTAPIEKNYRHFYLTSNNLVIFFPPVQVACYAAGVQEVPIPYAKLKEILNPRDALINFIK